MQEELDRSLNLFKKYFEEKAKKEATSDLQHDTETKETKFPKIQPIATQQVDIETMLRKRLIEEYREFAKLLAKEAPQDSDLVSYIEKVKAEKADQIQILTAADIPAISKLSTGSPNLDALVGGGLDPKSLTEIYGEPGTGKTQILFQIAVATTLTNHSAEVVFIDTEGTFHASRIKELAKRFSDDSSDFLQRIHYVKISDFQSQLAVVERLGELLTKQTSIQMVLIDSISALFRAALGLDSFIPLRQQLLNFHIYELKRLAYEFELAVVYSNQVYFGENETKDGWRVKPFGGNALGHGSTHRIFLEKGNDGYNYAYLISSPVYGNRKVRFNITSEAIL